MNIEYVKVKMKRISLSWRILNTGGVKLLDHRKFKAIILHFASALTFLSFDEFLWCIIQLIRQKYQRFWKTLPLSTMAIDNGHPCAISIAKKAVFNSNTLLDWRHRRHCRYCHLYSSSPLSTFATLSPFAYLSPLSPLSHILETEWFHLDLFRFYYLIMVLKSSDNSAIRFQWRFPKACRG